MKSKAVVVGLITAGLLTVAAGAASAAPVSPSVADAGVPIWAVPGLDVGSLLDPTIPLPTTALAPIDGLLKLVSG